MFRTQANPSSDSPQSSPIVSRAKQRLIRCEFARDLSQQLHALNPGLASMYQNEIQVKGEAPAQQLELVFAGDGMEGEPENLFDQLRWGGRVVCISDNESRLAALASRYNSNAGYILEDGPRTLKLPKFALPLGGGRQIRLPLLNQKAFYFTARKTHIVPPGRFTERFTYDVQLIPHDDPAIAPHGYIVRKRVPTRQSLLKRLVQKAPKAEPADLEARAHKLIDHVFPIFLTREAAMLQILQKSLPEAYRKRVPTAIKAGKDAKGFVRELDMTWLRMGRQPMTQLEFAIQLLEMLVALHDHAKIMHLDLRLDNVVISEAGVSFVDFGSAVRIGEKIDHSPMLHGLFEEMMRTSQIQRMLGRMIESGHVTNQSLHEIHGEVDPRVDLFYAALQMSRPESNPDTAQLVKVDQQTETYRRIAALTEAVLRPESLSGTEQGATSPPSTTESIYSTASDLLLGLQRIKSEAI